MLAGNKRRRPHTVGNSVSSSGHTSGKLGGSPWAGTGSRGGGFSHQCPKVGDDLTVASGGEDLRSSEKWAHPQDLHDGEKAKVKKGSRKRDHSEESAQKASAKKVDDDSCVAAVERLQRRGHHSDHHVAIGECTHFTTGC
ncbi:hypothetical protein MTO96_001249 [Rhipicephalus appendiculatus]